MDNPYFRSTGPTDAAARQTPDVEVDQELANLQAGSFAFGHAWGSAPSDDGDGEEAGAVRPFSDANRISVANERGDAVGAWGAPNHMTLDQAYDRYVERAPGSRRPKLTEREMRRFLKRTLSDISGTPAVSDRPQLPRSDAKRLHTNDMRAMLGLGEEEGEEEEEEEEEAVEDRALAARVADEASSASSETTDSSDVALEQLGMTSDDKAYIEHRFETYIRDLQVTPDFFATHMCPLCGFMGDPTDAVGDEELQEIGAFIRYGVGLKPRAKEARDTLAMLVAMMYNKNVYWPMRRENKRIMKLTFEMASDHIFKPHRYGDEWVDDMIRTDDTENLHRASSLLLGKAFYENPLTGEFGCDYKAMQYGIKCCETKYKILGAKGFINKSVNESRASGGGTAPKTNPLHTRLKRRRHRARHDHR